MRKTIMRKGDTPLKEIYLDNSSTTKVCKEAADKAYYMMTQCYGNPSSLHTLGFEAEKEMEAARAQIARVMGVKPEEITFTSGGTESNNIAIFGAAAQKKKQGNRIVTTAIEHPSVLEPVRRLEKEGFEVIYLKPDKEGHIQPEQVRQAIDSRTILVTMMLVNNEVGTILRIEAAARAIAHVKAPALLHVDAVQAFGKIPVKPQRLGADLVTISAHKIHGPKGIGALYQSKTSHVPARVFGGGQEKNLRPGTQSTPLIAAFGEAVRMLPEPTAQREKIAALCQMCREGLAQIPDVQINSPEDALEYVLNFSAGTVRSETMLHFLAAKGIYVSSGSACSKARPSHVLEAMGLAKGRIDSAIRVSFSRENTQDDVHALLTALAQGMASLAKR